MGMIDTIMLAVAPEEEEEEARKSASKKAKKRDKKRKRAEKDGNGKDVSTEATVNKNDAKNQATGTPDAWLSSDLFSA